MTSETDVPSTSSKDDGKDETNAAAESNASSSVVAPCQDVGDFVKMPTTKTRRRYFNSVSAAHAARYLGSIEILALCHQLRGWSKLCIIALLPI